MKIENILDKISSFIMDPSNSKRKPFTKGVAWVTTIVLGIGTIGIAQGLSALWRKLRHIEINDTQKKIADLFKNIFSKNQRSSQNNSENFKASLSQNTKNDSLIQSSSSENKIFDSEKSENNGLDALHKDKEQVDFKKGEPEVHSEKDWYEVRSEEDVSEEGDVNLDLDNVDDFNIGKFLKNSLEKINKNFTTIQTIDSQRQAHEAAKKYLIERGVEIKADVSFVAPPPLKSGEVLPELKAVKIDKELDASVFFWENTAGVQFDIQKDGKLSNQVVLYGVASQFNSAEATQPFTPEPGSAVSKYKSDPTQGPKAQLQFPIMQVEYINNAANLGLNGLCNVLDEETKNTIKHGFLTPKTIESAEKVIGQLKKRWEKIEYTCVGNIPKNSSKQEKNTQKVYEILVAAPAFSKEDFSYKIDATQKAEIEFLCALHAYRAQFHQAIQLADENKDKQVIFKPTTPGLGVFGNDFDNISKAFYTAAKEFEGALLERKVQVRLQVFQGRGDALKMAQLLKLNEFVAA